VQYGTVNDKARVGSQHVLPELAGGLVDLSHDGSLHEEERLLGVHECVVEVCLPVLARTWCVRHVHQVAHHLGQGIIK
jgi:hypothetical protein